MFSQFAHRLTRLTRLRPQAPVQSAPTTDDERQSGWHESSWVMAKGVEVIELPPSATAALFADTLPAFYEPDEAPLAA